MRENRRRTALTREGAKNALKTVHACVPDKDGASPACSAGFSSHPSVLYGAGHAAQRIRSGRSRDSFAVDKLKELNSGAGGRRRSRIALRSTLLAGAAACALSLAAPMQRAQAQTLIVVPGVTTGCVYVNNPTPPDPTSLTCQGDLSDGIDITTNVTVDATTINNLTAAIAPSDGVTGVSFDNTFGGDTTLTVDTGDYGVTTINATGVYGLMENNGKLTIDVAGAVTVTGTATASGIAGRQTNEGDVSIKSVGAVTAQNGHGIYAYGRSDGVDINSTGTVVAAKNGLYAVSQSGPVTVTSSGNIDAGGVAINVFTGGAVTINSSGDLNGRGSETIYGLGSTVEITSDGNLYADRIALYGNSGSYTKIKSTGNILANPNGGAPNNEVGILARAEGGSSVVDSYGNIEAENGYGIRATGRNDISVKSDGNIKAHVGIIADSSVGDATILSYGNIVAMDPGTKTDAAAIHGISRYDGGVTIVSEGNISTTYDDVDGIRGELWTDNPDPNDDLEDISITSTGDITVSRSGVHAFAGIKRGLAVRTPGARTGDIIISSTGNVRGDDKAGFYALAPGGGVKITSDGNVYSDNGDAIWAKTESTDGRTEINSEGNLYAGDRGIYAYSYAAVIIDSDNADGVIEAGGTGIDADSYEHITITSRGDIDAGESGIDADSYSGIVSVKSYGVIQAAGDNGYGIRAYGGGDNNVYVKSVGSISAAGANATGIYAVLSDSSNGDDEVRVNSNGAVTADGIAISGRVIEGDGDVFIDSVGAVTGVNDASIGIFGSAYDGDVTITSEGDASAGAVGIMAFSSYGGVAIASTGGVAAGAAGVAARSEDGVVSVVSNGDIAVSGDVVASAGVHGIRASSVRRVAVRSIGAVTANGAPSFGIEAYSSADDVDIYSYGAVSAGGTGIAGAAGTEGGGNLTIESIGDVAGAGGYGIRAKAKDGDVAVSSEGNVTGGIAAIYALVDDAGGPTGNITIVSDGDLKATGADGDGVRVVSTFDDSLNVVTISTGSAVTGGSGAGAGVRFVGGGTNRLENSGTITAASGVAIAGGAGAEDIINSGTLAGAVMLGAGNDRVEIFAGSDISDASFDGGEDRDAFHLAAAGDGVISSGTISNFEVFEMAGAGTWSLMGAQSFAISTDILSGVLDLQGTLSSGSVANRGGSLAIGGVSAVGEAMIDGDYVQEPGGDLLIDVDFENAAADLLSIAGTAAVAGTVTPTARNLTSGDQTITFLTAAGGVTDNGLTLNDFANPLISAELIYPSATDVALAVSIGFAPSGIAYTDDQAALAAFLDIIYDAGGADGALEGVFGALLHETDSDAAYTEALDQLSGDVFLSTQTAAYYSASDFSNGLFSCADKTDAATMAGEGECLWLRVSGGGVNVETHGATIGFEEEIFGVAAGWQFEVAESLQVGLGAGFETVTIDTDAGARSEGDRFMGGVSVKHQRGPLRLSAAFSGGVAEFDTTRMISIGAFSETELSTQDVSHFATELRVAYRFDFDQWYAQPFVHGNATWVDIGDVTESGGGAALLVEGRSKSFLTVTPGVELGAEFALSKKLALKPFLKTGVSFIDNPELGLTAGFLEAPSGVGAFTESADIDDTFAVIEAGVTLFKLGDGTSRRGGRFGELGSRAAVSLVYDGRFGEYTTQNHGFIKVAFPF